MRAKAARKGAIMLAALLAATPMGMAVPAAAQPAAPAADQPTDEAAAKHALAVRIVALAFPEEQRMAMFGGMIDAMSSQMAVARDQVGDKQLEAVVEKHLGLLRGDILTDLRANSAGLFDAIAVAYARGFSLQELQDIERFVATPSGAAYIQRSPQLLTDPAVAAWNTAYFQRVMGMVDGRKDALLKELTAAAKAK